MTATLTYPPADTQAQWFQDDYPGATIDPDKGVLHTTEGATWPGYEGGATAPTLTALPVFSRGKYQRLEWRQHFPVNKSARALRNTSGGVETNTEDAIQVELVGTCDQPTSAAWRRNKVDHVFWPEAPDAALEDLAEFVAWCHEAHGIALRGAPRWVAYPASYGNSAVRFSGTTWRDFTGWCGHQHVPENVHGDPGALDWAKVQDAATGLTMPPTVLDVSVLVAAFRGYLDDDKRQPKHTRTQVRRLQRALNQTLEAGLTADGTLDRQTIAAWREHERTHGGRGRDTVPDFASLSALASPRYDVRK